MTRMLRIVLASVILSGGGVADTAAHGRGRVVAPPAYYAFNYGAPTIYRHYALPSRGFDRVPGYEPGAYCPDARSYGRRYHRHRRYYDEHRYGGSSFFFRYRQ